MAGKKKKKKTGVTGRIVAQNRKARHNYHIEDTVEAGVMLQGTEVKSLRAGQASIMEAYARPVDGEIFLLNAYIPEYQKASQQFNHETHRARKLLLRRREIARLIDQVERQGMTLVPLDIHFNPRGIAKVQLGLARGKKIYDKRETEKRRAWDRQKARLLREKG